MSGLTMESIKDLYNRTMAQADPRVETYPFMGAPDKMLYAIGLYLLVVVQGPKMMASFKPLELRNTIIVYNFLMVLVSAYISLMSLRGMFKVGYSIYCDSLDKYQYNSNNEVVICWSANLKTAITGLVISLQYVSVGWIFFMSKLVEFLDTVFFILRKKNNQITFLHVYHHSTMTIFTWLGVKFLPGGTNIIYPLINSFIHAVMYTYYGLAAFGPKMRKYLWWKKYLTIMQISQFLIFLGQGILNSMYDCPFPKIFVYAVFIYAFTILCLFINFYVKAYNAPVRKPASQNGKVVENGHTKRD
ncbi:elongation of very long chain fatty acids protein 4 [Aplysia californica]|uniref:Elongation of very long chain fatty acids protein n=1 Tax=Aplysia californica TaxID=6500 RepID=A0ABM0ZWB6_APLCA|nr:elongation of very long chain fatty acids protein 4 [Aplysia californica]